MSIINTSFYIPTMFPANVRLLIQNMEIKSIQWSCEAALNVNYQRIV